MSQRADVSVTWEEWQMTPKGEVIRLFHLINARGSQLTVSDWGATLTSFKLAMPDGRLRQLVLGCDTLSDYQNQSAFLGATVGRYANRIRNAQFSIDGQVYQLEANEGTTCLHGGPHGFNNQLWKAKILENTPDPTVEFSIFSADGDQGFPGNANVSVEFSLTADDQIRIHYKATVDKPCPFNLTNHSYFNLDGVAGDVGSHVVQINADHYLPVDQANLPADAPQPVAGTPFDFRVAKPLNQDWRKVATDQRYRGFDHSFILNQDPDAPAIQVVSGDEKISMSVYTSSPAVQLYTGQYLEGTRGHNELVYQNRDGFCLETQFLPDQPNSDIAEACIVRPGEVFDHSTCFAFHY
ncbi:aldose epimerase family protein [Celerinatantimonas sp. YJH-8]|uniref:aldose epimerase family protein n=1 Tax=Celerinatantimonas sp. YJH-8 TaxID=3228714 RepID=UPI0038C85F9B